MKFFHKKTVYIWIIALAALALFWFVFFTNPTTLPLSMLIVPPFCVFVILSVSSFLIFQKFNLRVFKVHPYLASMLIGLLPVLYLLLRSLNVASFREILLVIVFLFLLILYVEKRNAL